MCEKRILLAVKGEQAEWLANQNNATAALRTLIQGAINKFGTVDLFLAAVESVGVLDEMTSSAPTEEKERKPKSSDIPIVFGYSEEVDFPTKSSSINDNKKDPDFIAMLGLN